MKREIPRRELHFQKLEDALADAQWLAKGPTQTSGNYSFGQILEHLARTVDIVSGHREGTSVPFPIRFVAQLFRSRFLTKPMKPGFKLPSKAQPVFWPEGEVSVEDGLRHYRESIDRFHKTDPLPEHPVFGRMTREQQVQLQCRHAELHLSFVHRAQ